jgi:hypothetical protein
MNSKWMQRLGSARAWIIAAVFVVIAVVLLVRH